MKYKITGFSIPFGGISWDRNKTNAQKYEYLFVFLSSKRILTNPIEMKIPEQCVTSVLDIKKTIVEFSRDIKQIEFDKNVLSDMIGACNIYLNCMSSTNLPHIIYKNGDKWGNLSFDSGMKSFRNSLKKSIILIEQKYNIKFPKQISDKW
jgi:hypothetical protein